MKYPTRFPGSAKTRRTPLFAGILLWLACLLPAAHAAGPPLVFVNDKDYPPLSYLDHNTPKGLSVDIIQAVGDVLGREVAIQHLSWDKAQLMVQEGKADVIGPMAISEERKALYDFTDPVITLEYSFFVKNDNARLLNKKDLQGLPVGVTAGGFPRQALKGDTGLKPVVVDDYADGLRRVEQGTLQAFAGDKWVTYYYLQEMGIHDIRMLDQPFAAKEAAFAIRKGNLQLRNELNRALAGLQTRGDLGKIIDRWSGKQIVFMTREKMQRLVAVSVAAGSLALVVLLSLWIITLRRQIAERKVLEDETRLDSLRFASLLRITQYDYASTQDLLDFALREAIDLTASMFGYIFHYDEATQLFTLNSWSKEVMDECSLLEYKTVLELGNTGLWGEAVRQRKPIIVNDFNAENPYKRGYPEGHAPLHSFLTIPVFIKDAIVAVIGVANKKTDYTESDIRQLTLMMDFVWKVTEQAKTDQELKASEGRYRDLLESIHLLAIIIDTGWNITFCNNHFLKVTGYTREEALGLNVPEKMVPMNEQDMVRSIYTTIVSEKVDRHLENHIITKEGDLRLIVWNRTPMLDTKGNVVGIASIGIDVTEHRHVEEQLRQAQKMEAVGLLAGGVAHDFNNILTVIGGYGTLLQMDRNLNKAQQAQVSQIVSSAEKAAQLTRGLLAFSRKQPLIMKLENLNEIVQHVHKFLARIIGEDITLSTSCSGPELPVIADRGQIEQVLVNLATNARDAMPNGGVFSVRSELTVLDSFFTVSHRYEAPPGRYALLTVSDTGCGIGKEHLDHIFEPFFTTKEVGKGTGLGLAIIYGIIKQHNGFINVYSEPGQGTTFRIYLPVQETNGAIPSGDADERVPVGGNETILVAEDDPAVGIMVSKILTEYGYEVILAEDGEDVIEKFRRHQDRIRMILMDMIMPKKNGREAFEEIHRIKPGVKVLFSSGYTADFIESRGVSEDSIELIMKPVKPMELLHKVRDMLDA